VQEADHALGRLRRGQPLGIPAHVTVNYPFRPHGGVTPEVQEELRALFGAFAGFSARFSRIERFPGVLYLAPEPVDRFVELTKVVVARWPESPPYEGAYTTIVPHLTVREGPEPRRLAARVQRRLPIDAAVHEVVLMRPDRRGRWSLVCSFPLGAT